MSLRPPRLRRCWLFLPGAERAALLAAAGHGADVLIQELEDFTPPERRADARALMAEVLGAWRKSGAIAAVRINPLYTEDGPHDLRAAVEAGAQIVMIPKVRGPEDVAALDRAIAAIENQRGLPREAIEIVPNIESAAALTKTQAIAGASARVSACLVASEDMAADLGAQRSPGGEELSYVRQRFLVECVAAKVVAIDCPFTWRDEAGCAAAAAQAARWGFVAKSAVSLAQVAPINAAFTPSAQQIAKARGIVSAFEAARERGQAGVEYEGSFVERPIYINAQRLLARAKALNDEQGRMR